jgi:hypothetical protein
MKTHFGYMENFGDYESQMWGCDRTACGYDGEIPTENATSNWEEVDCKKCLKMKDKIIAGEQEDEKHIIAQMGDQTDFENKTGIYAEVKP